MFKTYLKSLRENNDTLHVQDAIERLNTMMQQMELMVNGLGKKVLENQSAELGEIVAQQQQIKAREIARRISDYLTCNFSDNTSRKSNVTALVDCYRTFLKEMPEDKFDFSRKQKQVLTWWCKESPVHNMDGVIADGAIRSGKTISMSLSFVMWAMSTFTGQNFAMCGKTIGSFRRNVLFWLKLMLRSRGYSITDHRADNLLTIRKDGKENYFYIFGGKDERSQDLIQGITLAGVFFDEVALMPESFVNQATGRCSVKGSKFWFNCNPDGPYHWFKQNWIDKSIGYLGKEETERIRQQAAAEGKDPGLKDILYLHFTMDDNLSLDEEIKARYRSMYVGVFFKRYIMGLWAAAEGIIYDMFDENKHVQDSMANGWNYVKQQLNDNRDYIYDMDLQSAEAYVNSEYAVALTELEV